MGSTISKGSKGSRALTISTTSHTFRSLATSSLEGSGIQSLHTWRGELVMIRVHRARPNPYIMGSVGPHEFSFALAGDTCLKGEHIFKDMLISYSSSSPSSDPFEDPLFVLEPIEGTLTVTQLPNTLHVQALSTTPVKLLSASLGYHAFEYQRGRVLLVGWREAGEMVVYNRLADAPWFTTEEEKDSQLRLAAWNKWQQEKAQHLSFHHFRQEDAIDPMGTQAHAIIFSYGKHRKMPSKVDSISPCLLSVVLLTHFARVEDGHLLCSHDQQPSGQARWRNILFSCNWANRVRSLTAKVIEDNSLAVVSLLLKDSPLPSEMDHWNQLLITEYLEDNSSYCEHLPDVTLLRVEMGHTTVLSLRRNEVVKPTAYVLASFFGNGSGFTVQFSLVKDTVVCTFISVLHIALTFSLDGD